MTILVDRRPGSYPETGVRVGDDPTLACGGLGIRQHSTKQQITRYSLRPWRRFIPSSARVQVTELALPYSESAVPRYL